ncbi:MAG: MFS transporter [Dehalococcoidales bacterium]
MAKNAGTGVEAEGFRAVDYLKITVFGFGVSALWASLHGIIIPLRLLDFVPEALKNTYLDLLILSGMVLAMIVQPIAGAISDRSGLSWGRRRPYILTGTILVLLFLPGLGISGSYAAIFVTYCLLQVGANIAQGPYQGFIPDLVPEGKRGLASGVRALLNIVGGIALLRLIAPFMDRYFAGEGSVWLWMSLGAPAIIVLGAMLATVLMVKEPFRAGSPRLSLLSALRKSFQIDIRARPDFVLFLVACLLIFTAWGTLLGHALYYLMDVAGLARPAEATGDILIVVGIGMLAVVYPTGRLCDRVGRKPIAVSSALAGAAGIAALFFSQDYLQIMLSAGLLGISGGAWMSSQWALATDMVGKGEEARYLGLVNMSSAGAGAISRLIGPAIDFFNSLSTNLGYQIMLLVCFLFLIAGSILLLKIKSEA